METVQGRTERIHLNESVRNAVYDMFDGHCAYCGCDLNTQEEWHVDHILPISKFSGANDMDNYFPACPECNMMKSSYGLQFLRKKIEHIHSRLQEDSAYRIALKYGMVSETPHRVKFYYETHNKKFPQEK